MRYSDSYRHKQTPGAGDRQHHAGFDGSAPEVPQPFGAITLPAPPPSERNRRILHLLWWTLPLVVVLFLGWRAGMVVGSIVPLTILLTQYKNIALMSKVTMPSVRICNGRVRKLTTGLMKVLIKPKTSAAIKAVMPWSMCTPLNK